MAFSVLIVDDSMTTRALIKRSLAISGLPVAAIYEAGNGRDALEKLHAAPVSLVLADLHMPEMNGVDLAHRILSDPALQAVPVVIVSAEPSAARIGELRRAGVKGYLRKPFTPESIRDLVAPFVGAAA